MWCETLYTWASSLYYELEEGDYTEFFQDYFRDTLVLQDLLLIGLGVALVVWVLYYIVLCRASIKFGNLICWLAALLITGIITGFVSYKHVVGEEDGDAESSTGFYQSIYETQQELLEACPDDEEQRTEINERTDTLISEISEMTNSVPTEISVTNAFYSILFFFIFSLLINFIPFVNKWTIHAKAIPFPKK